MTILFFGAVALATLLCIGNWRLGIALWVVIAILQDPIRKITPGTPAYMTMSFVPVYLATFLGLLSRTKVVNEFLRDYRKLTAPVVILLVCMAASFVQAVSYGLEFLPAAALGVFSYAGGIPAVLIGYQIIRRDPREIEPLLIGFVVLTTLMLVGAVLEYSGVKFSVPLLGTIATQGEWRRWYSNDEWVAMISGFYRSPEILGWHAMAMVILCLYLLVRRPSFAWLWVPAAAIGMFGVIVSGRRKMFLMVLVFVATFLVTSGRWRRNQLIRYATLLCILLVPLFATLVEDNYLLIVESGLASSGESMATKGGAGIIWVAPKVGPFGFGVGTVTQGAQHFSIRAGVPRLEGGLEKVLVELGLLGFAATLFLGVAIARQALGNLRAARRAGVDMAVPAAVFSIITANLSAFVIAFQFFGDPFVLTLIGFFLGVLLSTRRWLSTRRFEQECLSGVSGGLSSRTLEHPPSERILGQGALPP